MPANCVLWWRDTMTRDDLLAKIQSTEWSYMKLKDVDMAAPKDSLEIISAFAKTAGGHSVFSSKQANGKPKHLSSSGMY